ncbi:MAG TPA: expansin EXLX1 family cellulose-binding protein [Pseudomonadota bacterium]|nr:expansin EXLX1 family cellulose-binding protein [Pseudomonadota bacterium]
MSLSIARLGARLGARFGGSVIAFSLLLVGCGTVTSNSSTNSDIPQLPGSQPQIGSTQTGDGTYYGATGAGACSYDPSPSNLMVAAMNAPQWAASAVCGTCVDVTGPKGTVTVRIVDLCPECKSGDLDLSEQAFTMIADKSAGRVKISWTPVACAVSGPLGIHFKEGSNAWWMAVQVRNSRLPIKDIELQQSGNWVKLQPQTFNYYVADTPDPGPGPYTFRITAQSGQQVVESGIALQVGQTVSGTQQFQ